MCGGLGWWKGIEKYGLLGAILAMQESKTCKMETEPESDMWCSPESQYDFTFRCNTCPRCLMHTHSSTLHRGGLNESKRPRLI